MMMPVVDHRDDDETIPAFTNVKNKIPRLSWGNAINNSHAQDDPWGEEPSSTEVELGSVLGGFKKTKYEQVDQSVNIMPQYKYGHDAVRRSDILGDKPPKKRNDAKTVLFGSQSLNLEVMTLQERGPQPLRERAKSWAMLNCCYICFFVAGSIIVLMDVLKAGTKTEAPTMAPSVDINASAAINASSVVDITPPANNASAPVFDLTISNEEEEVPVDLTISNEEQFLWDDLVGLITANNTLSNPEDFANPHSSPYKALQWMLEDDKKNTASILSSEDEADAQYFLERYALITFYFATRGDSTTDVIAMDWIDRDAHTKKHSCHWQGVGCGHLHRVVKLNLTNTGLQGTLPAELKALEHLERLDLSHNAIGGTLPDAYSLLTNLKTMSLENNQLEGTIPDSWSVIYDTDIMDLSHNAIDWGAGDNDDNNSKDHNS